MQWAIWIEQYTEYTTGYWTFYKAMCITFIVHRTSFALNEELYVYVYLIFFSQMNSENNKSQSHRKGNPYAYI